ncbi:MAG: hypothetical protein JO352_17050 [Chloroflexi bacterium]|nr:hypothetical protein [Chloroflexota bacterium]
MLTHAGGESVRAAGAPVVDGMLAGFKHAEMWVDLVKAGMPAVSRRGFFERPPADEYARLRSALGKDPRPLTPDDQPTAVPRG